MGPRRAPGSATRRETPSSTGWHAPRSNSSTTSEAFGACRGFPILTTLRPAPRRRPPNLYYTGPFVDPGARAPIEFPWERLDAARPLVYASMGSLQNGFDEVFRRIAAACAGRDAQLVISLGGGGLDAAALGPLQGGPIVVRFAPQLDLLRRASLTITHAGLNTVLESLSAGVPMVAVPVTNDQPGVAARVEWCGAGRAVPLGRASVPRLRSAIDVVLSDPGYRAAAARLQQRIREVDGLKRAADLVEGAVAQNSPASQSAAT